MSMRTSVFEGVPIVTASGADVTSAAGASQWFPNTQGYDLSPYAGYVSDVWWQGVTSAENARWRWQESVDGLHWFDVYSFGFSG